MATPQEQLFRLKQQQARRKPAISQGGQGRFVDRTPKTEKTGTNWLGIAIGVAAIVGAAFTGGASLSALSAAGAGTASLTGGAAAGAALTTSATTAAASAGLATAAGAAAGGAQSIKGSLSQQLIKEKERARGRFSR